MSARVFAATCLLLFLAANLILFSAFFRRSPSSTVLPVTETSHVKNYLPQEPSLVPAAKTNTGFFVEPEEIDFGNIAEGNIVEGKMNLVNHTNSEIEIVNIVTSCGCSSSQFSAKTVPLGQTIPLPFTINTGGKIGDFVSRFEVSYKTNASEGVQKLFFCARLNGMTPGKIKSKPPHASFDEQIPSSVVTQSIILNFEEGTQDDQTLPTIIQIDAPDWLKTDLVPIQKNTNGEYEGKLNIVCTTPRTSGTISDSIRIVSSHDRYPVLTIPVSIKINGHLHIEPERIVQVLPNSKFPFEIDIKIQFDKTGTIQDYRFIGLEDLICRCEILEQNAAYRLSFDRKNNDNVNRAVFKGELRLFAAIQEESHSIVLPILIVAESDIQNADD